MSYRIIMKDALGSFVERIQKDFEVFAPRKEGAKTKWAVLEDAEQLDFGFINTDMSAKDFVFPQSECLMRFKTDGENAMVMQKEEDVAKRFLFNVRPCDAKALSVLDRIFCQDNFTNDVYWKEKRDNTIMAGLACNVPSPTCFCMDVNCGPHHEEGLDLLFTDLGDKLLVKVLTDRVATLVDGLAEADDDDVKKAEELKAAAEGSMKSAVSTDNIAKREVMDIYEQPYWGRLADTCLNCGTCTYVCPTCHCFDIQDENTPDGSEGRRIRNWDSCMDPLFTLHTSGHNPRGVKISRVRQRFMHKFKYIPMKRDGEVGCVGCGRCTRMCPVNIDVRDVVNTMNG